MAVVKCPACETEIATNAPGRLTRDIEAALVGKVQIERERIRAGAEALRPFGSGVDCACERCVVVNAVLALIDNGKP